MIHKRTDQSWEGKYVKAPQKLPECGRLSWLPKTIGRIPKPPTLVTVTVLAVVFSLALTFATVEIPRLINSILGAYFPDYRPGYQHQAMQEFTASVRPIGYVLLAVVIVMTIVGFAMRKRRLSSLGAVFFFLPTFGYFAAPMFFLAGLGLLRVGWLPFEGIANLLKMGDIVYVPYMIPAYLFALGDMDIRIPLAYAAIGGGLFIFVFGTITWFYGKYKGKETIDFWIYKYSRHPQYLGFMIWSYGTMSLGALIQVLAGSRYYPPVTLPWVISSLIIICVAMAEEIDMRKKAKESYLRYRNSAPFMFPLPKSLSSAITAPIRVLFKHNDPENRKEVIGTFFVYLGIIMLLSLPFLLINWPPPYIVS